MKILAIDPGTDRSAFVLWDADAEQPLVDCDIWDNERFPTYIASGYHTDLAIEMIASYGMPVGKSTFETCLWVGMFLLPHLECQTVASTGYDIHRHLVYRKDVKLHMCGTVRAKDANVRQALIDRYGEPGTKKNPGILYGVRKDIWSALAVAVYRADKYGHIPESAVPF